VRQFGETLEKTESKMTLSISKYRGRKNLLEKEFGDKEKFYINILDNDGQPKYQGYFTVESLLNRLTKDF
jgi:hypothetical protein